MTDLAIDGLVLVRRSGFTLGPLSLALPAHSCTALVGPSGCGKTTLLRCLAGLERPDAGTIRIGGELWTDGRRLVRRPEQRGIGFVFQGGALWPHLTAVDHLRFVDRSLSRERATALLDRVGLAALAARRPGGLSGGEAQRLSLARALAGRPRLLLLDEPLVSLDVHRRDELAALVRRVADEAGLLLLVVTHERDEALALADDLAVLRDGAIVEHGAVAALMRAPAHAFTAAFLCRAACLPLERTGERTCRTALGDHRVPPGVDVGAAVLAVLPDDVVLAPRDGWPGAAVLQTRRDARGRPCALVDLGGPTLVVPCGDDTRVGDRLPLALRAAPRFVARNGTREVRR